MNQTPEQLLKDLEAVKSIALVPTMLEVICQTTGMGFAAIARVTDERWIACSVRDEVGFGLLEGGELEIKTTLCNEIRDHRQPIVIDHVAEDATYKDHHTPKLYGLQSYISYPIILKSGEFFGTLCAIDAKPAKVSNTQVMGTFAMFAELLAFHLQSQELLERSYHTTLELQHDNRVLTNTNIDLDNFVFSASHDLKTPVSNLTALLEALTDAIHKEELDREEISQIMEFMKFSVDRFAVTIEELTTFAELSNEQEEAALQKVNLYDIVENVKQDLSKQIHESNAIIDIVCEEQFELKFAKKSFKSVLQNLLSNAIKYRSPERLPQVQVKLGKVDGRVHLSVSDNGLGIPEDKQQEVFAMYKRLHDHVDGTGLGLYIVKKMVDHHQGEIHVQSTLNQGTTFTIIL
ncbi:GAF domain-containing sensor histidine kinase [Nibribacter koreensis]|uniref:histidine kinase n=1 Tax=Nibribacter koreensis TaxID=1084519 RepID=A0ABP8FAH1_9BACT